MKEGGGVLLLMLMMMMMMVGDGEGNTEMHKQQSEANIEEKNITMYVREPTMMMKKYEYESLIIQK